MADARAQAARILSALTADERHALATEPIGALARLGFEVRMLPEPAITGDCSVAGSYDAGPPPVIKVVRAASTGRQHFSALHEFGHARIKLDTAIHDVFFDHLDGGTRFEEDMCDAIAGQLLIPDERVSQYINAKGPTAQAVIDLIEASPNSSREACCVRAAERIIGRGHVMLAWGSDAQFTANRGTPYRVRRTTPQGDDHVTAKAASRGRARGEGSVIYASGHSSDTFYADAALADDGYVVAVFVDANPPWISGFVLPRADPWAAAESEAYCTHCEVDFTTLAKPCPTCNGFVHPEPAGCGRCSCAPRTRDALCDTCFLRRPLGEFTRSPTTCDPCLGD
jgi:Zn-dependent peptidase ImmA (M78 family)